MQAILAIWNGGLMDLSKSCKIDCIKSITSVILKAVLARCDDDSRYYWSALFEELEHFMIIQVKKNSDGCRHLQIKVDREILGIINNINNIQSTEEKHFRYLELRKRRRPQYYGERIKRKKKHQQLDSDDDSCLTESENGKDLAEEDD